MTVTPKRRRRRISSFGRPNRPLGQVVPGVVPCDGGGPGASADSPQPPIHLEGLPILRDLMSEEEYAELLDGLDRREHLKCAGTNVPDQAVRVPRMAFPRWGGGPIVGHRWRCPNMPKVVDEVTVKGRVCIVLRPAAAVLLLWLGVVLGYLIGHAGG